MNAERRIEEIQCRINALYSQMTKRTTTTEAIIVYGKLRELRAELISLEAHRQNDFVLSITNESIVSPLPQTKEATTT